MEQHYERRFAHQASEVAAARHFVADTITGWGLANGDASLATSELATNAVRHTGTPFTVRITRLPAQIRVEVANGSPLLATPGNASDKDEQGRGLQILRAVATAWGLDPSAHGKTIWFTVAALPAGT